MNKYSAQLLFSLISFVFIVPCMADTLPNTDQTSHTAAQFDELDGVQIFSTIATFEDAKDDLLMAIEDKGLVVSYTSHAKLMFDRTKNVTGAKIPVYDNGEIILFCKADLSHDLVEENPHNIILCPYAIAIYVLHTEPERVYLSFRELDKSLKTAKPINTLLAEIINEVI